MDSKAGKWRFYIDVGGTFTDVIARSPDGRTHRCKLLTTGSAPLDAIRRILGKRPYEAIGPIEIRLGTTIGTNALLERKGVPVALVTTAGFADLAHIGNQDRPELFELNIRKPSVLFHEVIEAEERIDAQGRILRPLNLAALEHELRAVRDRGIHSLAVCLLNSYRNGTHEQQISQLAADIGFSHVSVSSTLVPIIKLVSRTDTTTLDAYLTPLLHEYIQRLSAELPQAELRLMTSAGGLVQPEAFVGKDSILSGPAGGIVGFSSVAQQAGFKRAIGFDMGGTSTDVARFDGTHEYQFETVKAGVRIVAPMLAIETVAAGGGSICCFDGSKLTVGPESAGASPGPACYGRGGPLAVTDLNVFLGRIPSDRFPFPLDTSAIDRRLREVAAQVQSATGRTMTHREIAEGFLDIANHNMAAPIKKISIARGYDIRDYCLAAFGGAGAQHACSIAQLLGMRTILIHPDAGVLSALGMGRAEVKKFREMTVLQKVTPSTLAQLEKQLEQLERELLTELQDESIPDHGILPAVRLLDMRYTGQHSTLTITAQGSMAPQTLRAAFEQLHTQRFGYTHPERDLEIVIARTRRSGLLNAEEAIVPNEAPPLTLTPTRHTPVVFQGHEHATPMFLRNELHPGHTFAGPCIVIEPTSTVVVDPGWQLDVTATGNLLLTRIAETGQHPAQLSEEADPVQLEIFNNHFANIAEQMGEVLRRTALSTNVKERLDFSCAVFSAEGDLVANAPHIPVHLGAMSETLKALLHDATLHQGDVIVTNDPYLGGSHLPDITVITPVFNNEDQLIFFTASRAHHAEIGGIRPGSMPPDSKTLAEEGVVIRHFKVVEQGRSNDQALRHLLTRGPYPSRSPEENIADIHAQIAANRNGVNNLLAMIERCSLPVVTAYMHHIRKAAERKARHAIQALPDGEYSREDQLDDGSVVHVTISIRESEMSLDFTGSAPVQPGNLNATTAVVHSAVMYCLRCLIADRIPLNAGVLAPVSIHIPPGLLNPPFHPDPARCAAVVGGNVETSQRIVDIIFGALNVCAASQGTMNNLVFGNARFGYYETICGGAGAGPGFHGADAVHTHMTNTRLTDPEVLETLYPVRLIRFTIRKNSGGNGKFCGGNGVVRELEFLEPLDVSLLTSRRTTAPFGLQGGQPGAPGINQLRRAGQNQWTPLNWRQHLTVNPGDRLRIQTPGGGGYSFSNGRGTTIAL
jgi:5-oxoprolinase (ATP-hydrolysing)